MSRNWEGVYVDPVSYEFIKMLQVVPLMELNGKRAVQMLINQSDSIDATEVVSQLQKEDVKDKLREYLHLYLHSLFEKDPTAAKEYHGLQVLAISLARTCRTVSRFTVFFKQSIPLNEALLTPVHSDHQDFLVEFLTPYVFCRLNYMQIMNRDCYFHFCEAAIIIVLTR